MNKMKEVAQLLGVELGEKFEVTVNGLNSQECVLKESGLFVVDGNCPCAHTLKDLLVGSLEIKKPTLNKVEKEYLENVIRPFRDTVECIAKNVNYSYKCSLRKEEKSECIAISIKDTYDVCLPPFKLGSMYKGMKADKAYTLKELGLFEGRLEKESEEK